MSKGPEAAFQQFVVEVLEDLCHFDVYVLAQPRAFLGTPGLPDLLAIHTDRRLRIFLELKAPEGSHGLTDAQRLFFERWSGAGGDVHLIASEARLEEVLAEYGFEVEVAA